MFNSILGLKKKEEETDDSNSTTTLALPSVPSENEENSTEKKKKSIGSDGVSEDASSCVMENLHIPVASQEDYLPKHLKLMCQRL